MLTSVASAVRNQMETQSVLPQAVKSKEVTFAVVWTTADAQVEGRDMEDFSDNLYSQPPPPQKKKSNSLDRKPLMRTL